MKAWKCDHGGGIDDLVLQSVKLPPILHPKDVLIKVCASSVNPLDVAMLGNKLFNFFFKSSYIFNSY